MCQSVLIEYTPCKMEVQHCVAAVRITQLEFSTEGDQKVEAVQFMPLIVCSFKIKILALS